MGNVVECCTRSRDDKNCDERLIKQDLELLCNSSDVANLRSCQQKLALLKKHSPLDVVPSPVAVVAKAVEGAGHVSWANRDIGDFGHQEIEAHTSPHVAFDNSD